MAAVAGYNFYIKKSGTSTGFTDEATTNTSGDTWRLNTVAKRVFDRDTAITVYDNAVEVDAADIASIDYMFGEITFTGAKSGPITVDGSYMPLTSIAGAKDVTLMRTRSLLDSTDIDNSDYRTKEYGGIQDITISASRWFDVDYTFHDILEARTPVVIDYTPDGTFFYRGWFLSDSVGDSANINELLEESLSFQLAGSTIDGASFSYKVVS
jgi:hypothetical protein